MVSSNSNFDSFKYFNLKKSMEVHLNRSETSVLYFYDTYDANLWEKKFGRSMTYSCRQMPLRISLFYEKRIDTAEN